MSEDGRRIGVRSPRRGVLVALSALVALAMAPTSASADTLSLGLEPAIPGKGKPFELIATGTATAGDNPSLVVYFAPGSSACATTAALESENPNNSSGTNAELFVNLEPGPFEERTTFAGDGYFDNAFRSGVTVGHYRACGYIYDGGSQFGSTPRVAARLEFTVGGTCDTATAKVIQAENALEKAKKKLKAAKESGDKQKIKKAKKAVKKAKKKLRIAKEDQTALC